jgi:hypothetical protein
MLIQIYKNGQSTWQPVVKDKAGNFKVASRKQQQTMQGGSIIKDVPVNVSEPVRSDESRKKRIQSLIDRL